MDYLIQAMFWTASTLCIESVLCIAQCGFASGFGDLKCSALTLTHVDLDSGTELDHNGLRGYIHSLSSSVALYLFRSGLVLRVVY